MIDPYNVAATSFEQSHLLAKLQKLVAVARVFESVEDSRSPLHSVAEFDLDDPEIYNRVKAGYGLVRQTIINRGFHALTGKMGVRIQPRTKGAGHGSTSRAFYARTSFVAHILGEGYPVPLPGAGANE